MKILSYKILLRKEPEGGYTVIVPSLPGCITYGDSIEQAMEMAKEAIELYIDSLKEHGEEIPTDDQTLAFGKSRGSPFHVRILSPLFSGREGDRG